MALVRINDDYIIETRGIVSITNQGTPSAPVVLVRYQKGESIRMLGVSMTEAMAKLKPNVRFRLGR